MKKMCPRCGTIFEVKNDPVYCSAKCRELFKNSGLDYLKGKGGTSNSNSEIMRPRPKK